MSADPRPPTPPPSAPASAAAGRLRTALETFEELVDLAPEVREARLLELRARDTALAAEVEALLRVDQQTDLLEAGAAAAAAGDDENEEIADELAAGTRLGAYRIVARLGAGGMGSVHLAERADGAFSQRVAVKVVRTGARRAELARRFAVEREILGRLEHPGIARILDAGQLASGDPYLVMEHVEGERIDRYCDERGVAIEERLRLFRRVCDAVRFAHRNLVVHRDLKPANILVTADGEPKLLDFGIARLLEVGEEQVEGPAAGSRGIAPEVLGRRAAAPPTLTFGRRALTPAYASPEQLRGQAVTTASDVFSLGVLLCELLTGRRPPRPPLLREPGGGAVAPPPRPSSLYHDLGETRAEEVAERRGTTPARLRRRLRGDLDRIALRALAERPEDRYGSVEELAEDLDRHLRRLPIRARPATPAYVFGRFVRRHAAGVAAALLVLATLLGGIVATSLEARRAAAARDRAQAEARRAEEMSGFLRSLLQAANPIEGTGREVRVAELLDGAAARLDERMFGRAEVLARLRITLSETYAGLGLLEEAEREARRAVAAAGGRSVPAAVLADALRSRGVIEAELDSYEESERTLRHALAVLGGQDPTSLTAAMVWDQLGVTLQRLRREDEAEQAFRRGIELLEAEHPDERMRLATTLNNYAVLLGNRGDVAAAEPLHRRAVELWRAEGGVDHPRYATALENLAGILDIQGRPAEAEPLYRETVERLEAALGEAHPETIRARASFGSVLAAAGRAGEAVEHLEVTVERARPALGHEHFLTAYAEIMLGHALALAGRTGECEAPVQRGLATRRKLLPHGHWLIATAQNTLGLCLIEQGQLDQAEAVVREARETLLRDRGPEHEKTRQAEDLLARIAALRETPRS